MHRYKRTFSFYFHPPRFLGFIVRRFFICALGFVVFYVYLCLHRNIKQSAILGKWSSRIAEKHNRFLLLYSTSDLTMRSLKTTFMLNMLLKTLNPLLNVWMTSEDGFSFFCRILSGVLGFNCALFLSAMVLINLFFCVLVCPNWVFVNSVALSGASPSVNF